MKKLFLFIAALLATTTLWAYDFQSGDLYYNITSDTTVEVTYQYQTSDNYAGLTTATIPETITYNGNTYSVTSIGKKAFIFCSSLTSVTIPNSVTSIGEYAFRGCSSLTSITIPEGVTSIRSDAFYACSSLTSVILNSNDIVSKDYTTSERKMRSIFGSQVEEYVIGNSVTSIGSCAFEDCSSLTSVTIGNSVTSIGFYAFSGCSSLIYVTIGSSVTSIGERAFYGCSSLTSITIPYSVTTIGEYAFSGCSSLTDITIPNSVTKIGNDAFSGTPWCNNQPDGVIYVGKVLYRYNGTMPANTSIAVEEGIVSIAPSAFSGCSGLTSLTIPNSVTSIGFYAFSGCSSLTSINIPEGVTNIEAYTFLNCSSLTSITIPNNVKSVEHSAFSGCSSLASITFPDDIISIGEYAFDGTSWYTNQPDGVIYVGKVLYKYKGDMPANTNIAIKDGTISISPQAFQKCSTLISVVIPNSVTNIGYYAFSSCSSLSSVTIGKNVTTIGGYAFAWCENSLTSITLPENITSIASHAFYECDKLVSVVWNAKKVNEVDDIFDCERIKTFVFGDSVEYIPASLCRNMSSLSSVTIGSNVTSIGDYAFSKCTSLSSVTIPNSVTTVGRGVFYGCSALESVVLSENITELPSEYSYNQGDYGFFRECSSLKSISIPHGVTNIGNNAFYGCSSLTKTNYTGDVASWCNIKFGNSGANPICYSHNFYINDVEIKDLIIPNSVDSIHKYAFSDCSSLTSVTIPNSVTSIGVGAFSGCDSLSFVVIGSGVTSIEYSAFRDCPIDTVYSRNPTPPQLKSSYSEKPFTSKPVCYIPCGATSSYKNSSWKDYMSKFVEGNVYFLNTSVSDPLAGRIETIRELTCDEATFQAIPNVGYEFVQWSDGVADALRTLNLTQDTTLIAEFRQLFDGKCGDNLYWKHYDNKIIIHGEGAMYDYAADSVPWYQFRDIVKTVEVFDGATSIGNNAFTLCKNLNTLTLPGTITNIGDNAFGGCRMLFDIYCYILFPPIASENSFVNYNAYLYILCDYQRYYEADMVFGNFRNMQCIGTQSTPTDGMVITPSFNDVTITWPTVANAGSYTLAINKDGEVFCTLTFNAAGQLTGIAFAPSRNGQRHAPAATQSANGFTFTVTGLDEGTDYSYNLVIKDNAGKTLQTYSGDFRTQSTNDRTVTVEYDALQGEVIGAGVYQVGDTVTLTAIPNDGYRFVRWSNDVEDNPYTFVISENIMLSAEFTIEQTAVENISSPTTNCQKIIRDGQLYIYHNGSAYNVMGVLVE